MSSKQALLDEEEEQKPKTTPSVAMEMLVTYGYVLVWITLSAAVILINKYILSYAGFPFPIALTMCHMAFCSSLAGLLIRMGVVEGGSMDRDTYLKCVLPIAALFSGTLWLGNAAYLYLTVSFIQMLKASMPVTVFIVGVLLGTEKYSPTYALNLVTVGLGVGIASYGEMSFHMVGVALQVTSIITESFRLSLIQILLQNRGIRLNPVTTLYYIAPACFCFLCIPFCALELPTFLQGGSIAIQPWLLLASALAAFALNMAVFLLIGRSSALTMNVAGVLKDWLLIAASIVMYGSQVTRLQLGGYSLAFLGVCWYNHQKMQMMKLEAIKARARPEGIDREEPLLANRKA